jgi:hypothetical protein
MLQCSIRSPADSKLTRCRRVSRGGLIRWACAVRPNARHPPSGRSAAERDQVQQALDVVQHGRGLFDTRQAVVGAAFRYCGQGIQRVLATLWFATGGARPTARGEVLLYAARAVVDEHAWGEDAKEGAQAVVAGVTAVQPSVRVLRALAHRVEPAMALRMQVRAAWRQAAWQLAAYPPRTLRT